MKVVDRTSHESKDIQITGGMGVSYQELKLIGFDEDKNEWVNLLTMGTPEIIDLDGNGEVAIVGAFIRRYR